jgi:hypothetical protein
MAPTPGTLVETAPREQALGDTATTLLARVPAKPNPSRIAATTMAAILCLAEASAQGAASATDGASLGLWTAAAIAPAGHLIEDSSAMGISVGETVCRVSLMQQCRP